MNQKELLLLAIGVFCTIFAWLIVDIYHIQTAQNQTQMKPAPVNMYNVDNDIFTTLKNRQE